MPVLDEDWKNGGFGLYIHWPFCAAKCPYCDFNSHVSAKIDSDSWHKSYISEIVRYGQETAGRTLSSVYFGGGTPSLMEPKTVGAILDEVAKTWSLSNDLEVTLEANPSSVEAARFQGFRAAGVRRVSMGFQALDDDSLRKLGRLHDVKTAMSALEVARDHFDRVSFDLIYARQDQSLAQWEAELTWALSLQPDHLSLYQLTIEEGTAFGDRFERNKLPGLPSEDLSADMYFLTQDMTEAAGLPAYEVSNHARDGEQSRHNLIYWRGGDYVGIGPGAHGRLTLNGQRTATWTELMPTQWLKGPKEAGREPLSRADHAGEYLMMSLRTTRGTSLGRFEAILGSPLEASKINALEGLSLVECTGGRLRATRSGRAVLNAILADLLPN
ncbi:MAG: radical SAM family heme chaperone HemW [Maritimibacter sp.]